MTEQETVRQSVQERQSHQHSATPTVSWPPSGGTPVNEFNTEGYISCAFPTLFPTGAPDFIAPRPLQVTVGNYFKHLLLYKDGQAPSFSLLCSQHRDALASTTYSQVASTSASTRMMPSFQSRISETWSVVKGKSSPTECCTTLPVYVEQDTTGSGSAAASLPWSTHLVCQPSSLLTAQQISNGQSLHASSAQMTPTPAPVQDNPTIAVWFFHHRIQKFIDAFYVGVLGATDFVRSLKEDSTSLKAVQKLLISSTGDLSPPPPASHVQGFLRFCHAQPGRVSCSGGTLGRRPPCNNTVDTGPLHHSASNSAVSGHHTASFRPALHNA